MPTDLSSMSRIMQNLSSAFGISQEAIEAAIRAVSDFVYESIVEAFPEGFDDQTPVSAGYGEFAEVRRCYDAAPEWKIHQQAERQLFYQLEEQKHKYDDDDWESMILNGVAEINTRKEFKLCQPEIQTPLTLELDQSSSLQTFLRQSKSFSRLYSAESLLI